MKPGHGEILLAEGDVTVAEQERELIEAFRRELDAGMWAAVPTESSDGRRQAEMVKSFDEIPRDTERVIFFPAPPAGPRPPRRRRGRDPPAAGRGARDPAVALGTAADHSCWYLICGELAIPHLRRLGPGVRTLWERLGAGSPVELCYDPGRELRAEQRARMLLSSCVNEEEWAMYRDLGFLRVWGTQGRRSAAASPRRLGGSDVRVPGLPPQAAGRLPSPDGAAPERVLRRLPRRGASLRECQAAGRRRRAREVDGPQGRRARADRAGQHAPARSPARPESRGTRLAAAFPLGAAGGGPRADPQARARGRPRSRPIGAAAWAKRERGELRRQAPQPRPDRRPRAGRPRARTCTGIGYDDEALAKPLIGVATVDRDDAVQLQPPRAGGEGQGGHPRGRRDADGVQHDLGLGRDHDGDAGHAGLAGLARGDRRLDRARRARRTTSTRSSRSSGCDKTIPGAVMALARLDIPGVDALRRLDPRPGASAAATSRSRTSSRPSAPTPPARSGRGAARARGGRLARRRRLRRPVHREHDGDRVRVPGDLARPARRWSRPRTAGKPEVARAAGRTRDGRPPPRPAAERDDHARRRSRTRSPRSPPAAARPTACCTCWRVASELGRRAVDRRVRRDLRAHAADRAT